MQSNSDKQDYSKQNNNYSSEGVYSTYQGTPPSYSTYPQQCGYGVSGNACTNQAPLHQQTGYIIAPAYQPFWTNRIAVPLTTNLRLFLGISGFIYALWGISAVSVQVAIIINSISSYYHGFWAASFLIAGGIIMMIAAFRSAYPLHQMKVNYIINLSLCTMGLVFSIVNYIISPRCTVTSFWYCDSSLSGHLRIALLVLFIMALIHTIINMIVVNKEHKRALSKTHPSLASY